MTHLDTSNTSCGQKKGRESNWQFDSRPLKVKNFLDFLACRWRAKYFWKALNEGYNFALNLISIGGAHTKLWAPKVTRVPTLGISGLLFGSPKTKWHLGVGPVTRHRVYYKGKVVASPKFGPWWVSWIHGYPRFIHAPKCSNYTLTNLLFGLCRSMWLSELLVNHLSPILEL
jgi:hypothetical protein